MACLNRMRVVLIIIAAVMIIGTATKAVEVEEDREVMGLSMDQYDVNDGRCLPAENCQECFDCLGCKENEMGDIDCLSCKENEMGACSAQGTPGNVIMCKCVRSFQGAWEKYNSWKGHIFVEINEIHVLTFWFSYNWFTSNFSIKLGVLRTFAHNKVCMIILK